MKYLVVLGALLLLGLVFAMICPPMAIRTSVDDRVAEAMAQRLGELHLDIEAYRANHRGLTPDRVDELATFLLRYGSEKRRWVLSRLCYPLTSAQKVGPLTNAIAYMQHEARIVVALREDGTIWVVSNLPAPGARPPQ